MWISHGVKTLSNSLSGTGLTCAAAPMTLRTTVIVDNNECWAYEAVAYPW